MPEQTLPFHFHSDAVSDDAFTVEAFEFRERMSEPFRLTLTLLTRELPSSIPSMDILKASAYFDMKHSLPLQDGSVGSTTRRVYGSLESFEIVERALGAIRCRAVLVPQLWTLSLGRGSRVFQDVDVSKIISKVLGSLEFDSKLSSTYPQREFVVQYNESDLDFLQRWLEHEGIFYFFGFSEDRKDYPIFADSADGYLTSMGRIRFRPKGELRARGSDSDAGASRVEEAIDSFLCRVTRLPGSVQLKDYNYRTPSLDIKAVAEVESAGVGTVYEYGDHYKTPDEGKALAKVRAEAIKWREKVFEGSSDCRAFRPGSVFTLDEHFNPDFNGDYAIVSVTHRVTPGSTPLGTPGLFVYENEFKCIPSSVVFRPKRKTSWPVVGTLNAFVDAAGTGTYAEIDGDGRYKVKLPFDLSDSQDGKASRYVRMAQPYAGAEMGMHFPLHKGTEVLLTFIDGDPDRPIIASAIPNASSAGPVNSKNHTQCALVTGGGSKMVFEDTAGSQRFHVSTPTQGTFFQMGSKTDELGGSKGEGGGSTGAAAPGAEEGVSMGTAADINFQSARDYVHRTGGSVTIETTKNELKITKGDSAEETHGNKREWTKGDSYEETVGNSTEKTTGNKSETTTGDSTENTNGSTDETFVGTKTSKCMSVENEMTLGAKNSMSVAAESETTVGAKSEIFSGIKFESTTGLSTEANKGGKVTLCELTELKTANQKLEEVTAANEIKGGTITAEASTVLTLEGMTSIEIKCGGSSIKLSPSSIEIESPSITIKGSGTVTVNADGSATIKSSMITLDGQVMAG